MELTLADALIKGIEAHREGRIQDADRLYTAILHAQPHHGDANHNLGVLAVEIGNLEAAIPFFKKAVKSKPSVHQYWLSYINTLIRLDSTDKAEELLYLAQGYGLSEDMVLSIEKRLNKIKTAHSSNQIQEPPDELIQPVLALFNQGNFKQVLADIPAMLERFPNSITALTLKGSASGAIRQYDLSIRVFRRLLELRPNNSDTYHNLGFSFQGKGDITAALEAYNRALEINRGNARANGKKIYLQALTCDWKDLTKISESLSTLGLTDQVATLFFSSSSMEDSPQRHKIRAELFQRPLYEKISLPQTSPPK